MRSLASLSRNRTSDAGKIGGTSSTDFFNKIGHLRTSHYDLLIASGFATARACSMKRRATGLSVRFLRVTMPNGTRAMDSLTGKTLISGRRLGNLSIKVGTMERKRPVATRLIRASAEIVNTVARG